MEFSCESVYILGPVAVCCSLCNRLHKASSAGFNGATGILTAAAGNTNVRQCCAYRVAGEVPAAPSDQGMPIWSTRPLLIDPGVLRVLQFQTDKIYGTDTLDDFVVTNRPTVVVILAAEREQPSKTVGEGLYCYRPAHAASHHRFAAMLRFALESRNTVQSIAKACKVIGSVAMRHKVEPGG
jgi:hypothetical protein